MAEGTLQNLKFRTADNRFLSYRLLGTGPVLVCHSGGPGLSSIYLGDLAGLSQRFTLIILNPRGTNDSDRPLDRGAYRINDYASDLEELRLHLGLEAMLLLGFSHGGVVAQAYALANPGRVKRLVLAGTSAWFGPRQQAATHAAKEQRSDEPWYPAAVAAGNEDTDDRSDDQLREIVFRSMPFSFAHFGPTEAGYLDTFRSESVNGDALRAFGEEIPKFDFRSGLAALAIPTLVITGTEDFICGPVCAADIGAAMPGAKVVIVADTGHMVFFDQPQTFHDEVASFLETAEP